MPPPTHPSSIPCTQCGHGIAPTANFCGWCGATVERRAGVGVEGTHDGAAGQLIHAGRFELLELLGEGGMGQVYRARDTQLGRTVAIKLLAAHLVAHPTARTRMIAEARALARVDHPHVVRLLDVFEEGDRLALVLEYVPGGDLGERIDRGGMSVEAAMAWMEQILAGLQALHEAGLVHRDVKPANILLTDRDVAKIADLGVVHGSNVEEKAGTRFGARLGTPAYMSPEQVIGITVDARTDTYAAGVLAYELLTGGPPFTGEDEDVYVAHLRDEPSWGPVAAKSEGVARVLAKALGKEPEDRFASADAFWAALLDPETHCPAEVVADETEVSVEPTAPARPSRRRGFAVALTTTILVGAPLGWLYYDLHADHERLAGELLVERSVTAKLSAAERSQRTRIAELEAEVASKVRTAIAVEGALKDKVAELEKASKDAGDRAEQEKTRAELAEGRMARLPPSRSLYVRNVGLLPLNKVAEVVFDVSADTGELVVKSHGPASIIQPGANYYLARGRFAHVVFLGTDNQIAGVVVDVSDASCLPTSAPETCIAQVRCQSDVQLRWGCSIVAPTARAKRSRLDLLR